MDVNKLHKILRETTIQIRKGAIVHGSPELVGAIECGDDELPGGVVSIDMMPSDHEVKPDLERIDCHFITIGVDKAAAAANRAEFIEILNDWPRPERLAGGPSYIEVGAEIGDQGAAFQMFALGKMLGLWSIITPETFGMEGEEADRAAGSGYIMISGYRLEHSTGEKEG